MTNAILTETDPHAPYALAPAALLIVASDADGAAMAEALQLAGVRLLAETGLAGAAAEIGTRLPDLIAIEAGEAGDPLFDALLGEIDAAAHAHAHDVAVIAAMPESAIDAVSASLLGGASQLLCAPSMAERVAAILAVRERSRPRLNDATRDAELAPLQRLNEEVARIAEMLARLTRGEQLPQHGVRDTSPGYRGPPLAEGAEDEAKPGDIRAAIRSRRLRAQHFDAELFADPAWDMLLDLYAAALEGRQVSVSSLCIAAAVPPTTALRWIGTLHDAGLFERHADPVDRRRAYIALSAKAMAAMRAYLAAVRRMGLPIA